MLEDLNTFFNASDFAQSVVFGTATVQAIFDNGNAQASVGDAGMQTFQPSLTLATASVPAEWFHATVQVPGQPAYWASAHLPDGTGVSRVLLELP